MEEKLAKQKGKRVKSTVAQIDDLKRQLIVLQKENKQLKEQIENGSENLSGVVAGSTFSK